MSNDQEAWDQPFADELDGSTVLVGLTHNEPSGPRLEQFFGVVIATDEQNGVTLQLQGSRAGETFQLPPHLQAFHRAAPGTYKLRQTGEEIANPDFTTTWKIDPPDS